MEEFLISTLPYLGLLIGVAGRVLIPWYVARLQRGEIPWDTNKAKAQLLTGALAFLALLAANPDLSEVGLQGSLAIGLGTAITGWGLSDMGRESKKALDYSRINNNKGRMIR